jgi:hypothetical protein
MLQPIKVCMVAEPHLYTTSMVSDSSVTNTIPSSFSVSISEKLTKANYRLWRAQIMPPIRVAQLVDLLTNVEPMLAKTISVKSGDSTIEQPNPEYIKWMNQDQALLGYLLSSMTREVLTSVMTLTTSVATWSALEGMFTSTTWARSVNICIALVTTKKGASSMAEHYSKMKMHTDEMASSGHPLSDEESVAYVLTRLDEEIYNALVSSIVTRV